MSERASRRTFRDGVREVMPNICECGHNVSRHGIASGCWDCECRLVAPPVTVESGSDEERSLRGQWATRMMFGFLIGVREDRTCEEFLSDSGVRLD